MNRIVIILSFIVTPLLMNAQDNDQINFSSARNWKQLLAEAKVANKPIFIDLYATWCTYCRQMDREVFTNKAVAAYVNSNFVAVKVQMDTSKKDNEYVKSWYADAAFFKRYVRSGYPCYLFFTAEGKYAGNEEGFKKAELFLTLLQKTIDPKGSYATQIALFQKGTLNKDQLLELAYWSNKNKDSLSTEIAKTYKQKYVDPMPVDSLWNPESDKFNVTFVDLFSFDDKIVPYIYNHQKEADSVFRRYPGYAKNFTDYIIKNQFINSKIRPNGFYLKTDPDWKSLENRIAKKFDRQIAKRLILDAKIDRVYKLKEWNEVAELEFERLDKYGMDTAGMGLVAVNNLIYDIVFKNVTDASLLRKAIKVMKKVVELDKHSVDARLDTYASILYKAGQKQKAIETEKQALNLVTKINDQSQMKFYMEVIEKMNKNIAIWME